MRRWSTGCSLERPTPNEIVLCELLATTLSIETVGPDGNFFELGGHSLLAADFVTRVRDRLGVDLPLRTLFEHPTVADLVTHLPGVVALCSLSPQVAANSLALIGLFNIAGSLTIGWLGQRYRMKNLLALMYASRAALILVYLLAPKTAATFYVFAAALGFTWLATVPPTAGLVGKLFGTRYLGTLFGLTLLSHQIGGFLGAYLGGLVIARNQSYLWMWYADIVLAAAAALINLPIREKKPVRTPVPVAA